MQVIIERKNRREIRYGSPEIKATELPSLNTSFEINRRMADRCLVGQVWEGDTFSPRTGLTVFNPARFLGTVKTVAEATPLGQTAKKAAAILGLAEAWWRPLVEDEFLRRGVGFWFSVSRLWAGYKGAFSTQYPDWDWVEYRGGVQDGHHFYRLSISFEGQEVMQVYCMTKNNESHPELSLPAGFTAVWGKKEFQPVEGSTGHVCDGYAGSRHELG